MSAIARLGINLQMAQSFGGLQEQDKVWEGLLHGEYPKAFFTKMTDEDEWSLVAWCGDFQIAHKDLWYDIGGYAEWQLGRNFADSYVLRKAKNAGYNIEANYNVPTWHLDHNRSSMYPEETYINNNRECLTKGFTHEEVKDWGLPNEDFEEFII
jgi:hypothetical protein